MYSELLLLNMFFRKMMFWFYSEKKLISKKCFTRLDNFENICIIYKKYIKKIIIKWY